MRLAVYGGSFDPPHMAHVLAAGHVLSKRWADQVLVVPVYEHAFNKRMESFEHRVRMCELAFAEIVGVSVSRIEAELPSPSYTYRTLEALRQTYPHAEFRFVVGADALSDTHKWQRFEDVCRMAPLIVLGRVGISEPSAPDPVLPEVSSTEIRSWLAQRRGSEVETKLQKSVPRVVLKYIEEHHLYGTRGRAAVVR